MPDAEPFTLPRLIGMVHLAALPGTPAAEPGVTVAAIADRAASEARRLADAGFDAVLIENMHDTPYLLREVGPEVTAAVTACAIEVRRALPAHVQLGIQILAGANRAALAAALASGARFIRAEGCVFAAVADEGLIASADAGALLRERRRLGAEHIAVLADVKKKHSSNAITADVSLAETVEAARFFRLDGVIVTGAATGRPVDADHLHAAKAAAGDMPIVVGSGATASSVRALLDVADSVIVGSAIKHDGDWRNPVEPERARAFVDAATGGA